MRYTTNYTPPQTSEDKAPEIRIFISSTFRDMQDEREYLIKHIFPELRTVCRERGVEFTEIDLRWGVTEEEAQQGKVVKICLDEIDRCRPYFIGLLGERYGWVPSHDDIAKDKVLVNEFPWIIDSVDAGTSVTEMEMVYGVLDNPGFAKHSYFYTRDEKITRTEFRDTNLIAIEKQKDLKDRIRESNFPLRENYTSIEVLGEMVRTDLMRVIEEDFPIEAAPTPLEQERRIHETYALTRRRAYIPRKENIDVLDSYASLDEQPLIVTGESGSGKSSLVSYWEHDYKKRHPDAFIITHFVGAGSAGNGHIGIIQRIMDEIKERYELSDDIPSTPESIEKEFSNWLAKVQKEQLILVVDGLDRLPLESRHLRWMPSYFPPNICAYFSVDKSETLAILQEKGFNTLEVKLLNQSEVDSLIVGYLGQFRKALSFDQRLAIIEDSKSANPLFLRTLLEELRIFGSFEELNNRIAHYISSRDTSELFQRVLARMEHDYGRNGLENILSLMWASRHGLSETELLEISALSRLELSRLLHTLEYQLMRHDGLLDFYHQFLRHAVDERYLSGENEREYEKEQHIRIADYFEKQEVSSRKATELPWQLQTIGAKERLRSCLKEIPMFLEFSSDDKHYELLGYWRSVGELDIMESDYESEASTFFKDFPDLMEESTVYDKFGGFFHGSGRFGVSESFYRRTLELNQTVYGAEHLTTAETSYRLAMLLKDRGNYKEAEPLYLRSYEIREKNLGKNKLEVAQCLFHMGRIHQEQGDFQKAEPLFREALQILLSSVGEEHTETAKTINNLALLRRDRGDLNESEQLFRKAIRLSTKILGKDHPNTAVMINNLAYIEQLKGNRSAAEDLYRQALNTCEKVYGKEHPTTAMATDSLAIILREIGEHEQALQLYYEALNVWEKLLGKDHINTASTLNNIGEVLMDMDRFEESEVNYGKAREIFEALLGEGHPIIAHPIHGMGLVNRKKGDHVRAAEFFKQAYEIREKALGAHHETLEALNDYISVVEKLDEPSLLAALNTRKQEIEKQPVNDS
jgi:nephrocystin-3